jgi:hypothetical protein
MNTTRNFAIIRKASPVSEMASEIGDGLHAVADAFERLAGVFAWLAAAENSDTHGRQKEMAAVIFKFAEEGFFSTKIDGVRVSDADADTLERMFMAMFPNVDPKKIARK